MDFKFPDVGEGITEGEIVRWRVKEGDKVDKDQVLVEVETDKAVVEIPSPVAGSIGKLYFKDGDVVKVGQVMVTIDEGGQKPVRREEPREPVTKEEPIVSTSVVGSLEEGTWQMSPETLKPSDKKEKKVLAMPAVKKLAKETGIDLGTLEGSGPEGRVLKGDIPGSEEPIPVRDTFKKVRKYDFYGYVEHVSLRGIRRTTAKKMRESLDSAAHVTHMEEIDVTELAALREREKDAAEKKAIRLTFLPFVVKAVIKGLEEYPEVNATLDLENEEIILKKYFNIGIAIDLEGALIVPVIKAADEKSILQLAQEISRLSELAKSRKIDISDLKGGTFTITNVGSIGGIFATPIINFPEVAILATGRIQEKPVVREGKIVVRKIMPVALSFDHRVLDGAEAARFVNVVKEYLENPDLLLME